MAMRCDAVRLRSHTSEQLTFLHILRYISPLGISRCPLLISETCRAQSNYLGWQWRVSQGEAFSATKRL